MQTQRNQPPVRQHDTSLQVHLQMLAGTPILEHPSPPGPVGSSSGTTPPVASSTANAFTSSCTTISRDPVRRMAEAARTCAGTPSRTPPPRCIAADVLPAELHEGSACIQQPTGAQAADESSRTSTTNPAAASQPAKPAATLRPHPQLPTRARIRCTGSCPSRSSCSWRFSSPRFCSPRFTSHSCAG